MQHEFKEYNSTVQIVHKEKQKLPFSVSLIPAFNFTLEGVMKKALYFDAKSVQKIVVQLLMGLKSVHDLGYLYNNLDPANIGCFVQDGSKVTLKLCDFSEVSEINDASEKKHCSHH